MDWLSLSGLIVAGVGAGIVGYAASLSSLISYPALLAFGLPPLTSNVTNTVALTTSSIGSLLTAGPELRPQARRVLRFVSAGALGGVVGALLLLAAPADSFDRAVPWLVAFASVVLLARPWLRRLRMDRLSEKHPAAWLAIAVIAIYGGYFGAAAGVLLLAVFGAILLDQFVVINALKAMVIGAANISASVVFAFTGPVHWAAAIPLAIGVIIGAALAPPLVRRIPEAPLRIAIAVAGLGLAVKLYLD